MKPPYATWPTSHTNLPLTAVECIEEMSKVTHLTGKQLLLTGTTDVLVAKTQKIWLQSLDISTWNNVCDGPHQDQVQPDMGQFYCHTNMSMPTGKSSLTQTSKDRNPEG
jgi:hypothetical protein